MNEKIKEIIDWCQEETDICIEDIKDKSLSDMAWSFATGKKTILDAVKDKLCSIYKEN